MLPVKQCGLITVTLSLLAVVLIVPAQAHAASPVPAPARTPSDAHGLPVVRCGQWNVVPSVYSGWQGDVTNKLQAITATSRSDAWAVGSSVSMGSPDEPLPPTVEHWNGTAWSATTVPIPSNDQYWEVEPGSVAAVPNTNQVWMVGDVRDWFQGVSYPLIEHWNGSQWNISLGPPAPGGPGQGWLFSVKAYSATNAWAVGAVQFTASDLPAIPFIEHWNGVSWHVVPAATVQSSPGDYLISSTMLSPHNIWAVGEHDMYSGNNFVRLPLIEHLDGTRWRIITAPSYSVPGDFYTLTSVSALTGANIWASGLLYNQYDQPIGGVILHWNGAKWAFTPSPAVTGGFASIEAVSPTSVWVVGPSPLAYTGGGFIAHWDGAQWTYQAAAMPSGGSYTALAAVAAVPGTNEVWAVGNWVDINDDWPTNLVERYVPCT